MEATIAEVNDRLIIELEAKVDKLAAGMASANRQIVAFARKAESDLTTLQLRLDIARAKGDKAAAERLQDEIALLQTKAKLIKSGLGQAEAAAAAEAHLAELAKARRSIEAAENGIGSAFNKVFDSSKLALVEEGGARLRVFGSAIEPLGAAGIAAAVGVVALSAAFEQSRQAIEYADGLYKAAAAAHTSTDNLQAMRVAVTKAGGDAEEAGQSLLTFSQILGKAQEGLVRDQRGFKTLGLGPEAIKNFKDSEAALDAVVARIQELRSPSQQDAAIQQLGLEGLAPLILQGAEAWKAYREEARASGLILDASVIAKAHALNVQLDELSGKIKNDMTEAWVNMGPAITGIVALVAKLADGVKAVTGELAQFPALFPLLGDASRLLIDPGRAAAAMVKDGARLASEIQLHGKVDFGGGKVSESDMLSLLAPTRGARQLQNVAPAAGDRTGGFDKAAQDAFDSGKEALAQAQAALISGIMAHAEAEKDAVDDALTKTLHDLAAKEKEIRQAKNDAHKAEQIALLDKAATEQRNAAEAKKELIDRQAATAALNEFLQSADTIRRDYAQIASNNARMATTAAERDRIETADLVLAQKRELDDFDKRAALKLEGKSGSDLAAQVSQNDAERAALLDRQTSDRAVLSYNQAGPLQQYLRGIQDLDTEFQTDGVQAIEGLTSGLIDAAAHARNLGEALKSIFLQLLTQMASQELAREAAPGLATAFKALLSLIPGHANGTDFAPGGLAWVGERGPELMNVPRGAQIIPNAAIRAASVAPAQGAARATLVQPLQFDLRGAVMTQDLLAQMQAMAAHASRTAAGAALVAGRKALPGQLRAAQLLTD